MLGRARAAQFKCWQGGSTQDLVKLSDEAFGHTLTVLEQLGPFCCVKLCQMYLKKLKAHAEQASWDRGRQRLIAHTKTVLDHCILLLSRVVSARTLVPETSCPMRFDA